MAVWLWEATAPPDRTGALEPLVTALLSGGNEMPLPRSDRCPAARLSLLDRLIPSSSLWAVEAFLANCGCCAIASTLPRRLAAG